MLNRWHPLHVNDSSWDVLISTNWGLLREQPKEDKLRATGFIEILEVFVDGDTYEIDVWLDSEFVINDEIAA